MPAVVTEAAAVFKPGMVLVAAVTPVATAASMATMCLLWLL